MYIVEKGVLLFIFESLPIVKEILTATRYDLSLGFVAERDSYRSAGLRGLA